MISFSIYLLFKGIRFIPDVCFFLLPAILSALNTYDFKLSEKFNLLIIPIAFIYCLNIHLFVFAKPESIFKSGIGIHDASYPVEALKYISPDNSLKLYNDISSAGYLVWASDGKIKVFQDGRIHAYPPSFFKSIQEAVYSGTKWKELMETYKINTILLTKNECTVIQLNYLYTKEWRIVFEDNNYILAEKKL
ncbi:MAG: hypothetical protein ACD_79C00249G0020 [uncultured bacterium]|nr:MAG: hypothetical protein ACD_79C00249G0020 [uncultured bacterium]